MFGSDVKVCVAVAVCDTVVTTVIVVLHHGFPIDVLVLVNVEPP